MTSVHMCFRVLVDTTEKQLRQNRCFHKSQICLFLVLQSDNREFAVCLLPSSEFHFFSFNGHTVAAFSAQLSISRVSSSPEAYHSFRVMVVICYQLSSSQQPVTSVSKLTPPSSFAHVTVCIPKPNSCIWPG